MIKFFTHKNKKEIKGFTLVESLVAISIFTISLIASLTILSNGITNTDYAKSRIIATYLAQEGIEYMRNIRDTYMLYSAPNADAGWATFTANFGGTFWLNTDNLFSLAPPMPITKTTKTACTSANSTSICPNGFIYYDSTTGKYGYNAGWTKTIFSRKITVTNVSANEVKVKSEVSWIEGSALKVVGLTEDLFIWITQ